MSVKKRNIIISVLFCCLIFTAIFVGLIFHASRLLNDLEQETYGKIAYCVVSDEESKDISDQVQTILDEHQNKKDSIEKKTLIGSITSFVIALGIMLASLGTIVENIKNIWADLKKGDKYKNKSGRGKPCDMEDDLVHVVINHKKFSCSQIEHMMKEICNMKECGEQNKEEDFKKIRDIFEELFKTIKNIKGD
ncbi:hypothetical protein IZY60_07190 [Lutibacter sp. B2]|nr:hypothetical protein [Lutibacter sp. B2]